MPQIRLAACQINTVVGDLDGQRRADPGRPGRRPTAPGPTWPCSPSWPSPATRPRTCSPGRPSWPTTWRRSPRWPRPRAVRRRGRFRRRRTRRPPAQRRRRCAGAARCCGRYVKRLLPNYGVFDEQRWFAPGAGRARSSGSAGVRVGVSICEDMWSAGGPSPSQAAAGAGLLVNANASPYSGAAARSGWPCWPTGPPRPAAPIVYVNHVGGQDELVFDGASLVVDADGGVMASRPQFAEEVLVCRPRGRRRKRPRRHRAPPRRCGHRRAPGRDADGRRSGRVAGRSTRWPRSTRPWCSGTRDYVGKNGFTDAVIGLSGGIDSSLVAAVAVDAVGRGARPRGSMPSRYSSRGLR